MEHNKMTTFKDTFLNGLIKNNPTFVLVLGMCPTLAMTSNFSSAASMGLATTFVLIFSNLFVSLLRRVIPDKMRIPCYIIIISTFVIIVKMFMRKYFADLYSVMGVFLDLIVVNCIILARAESFASQNSPLYSMVDGLSMGLGFTASLSLIGIIRELVSDGSVFGYVITDYFSMIGGTGTTVLGFITLACLMAAFNQINAKIKARADKKREHELLQPDLDGALSAGGEN